MTTHEELADIEEKIDNETFAVFAETIMVKTAQAMRETFIRELRNWDETTAQALSDLWLPVFGTDPGKMEAEEYRLNYLKAHHKPWRFQMKVLKTFDGHTQKDYTDG